MLEIVPTRHSSFRSYLKTGATSEIVKKRPKYLVKIIEIRLNFGFAMVNQENFSYVFSERS